MMGHLDINTDSIIGGNMVRWYGGFDSYMVGESLEFR